MIFLASRMNYILFGLGGPGKVWTRGGKQFFSAKLEPRSAIGTSEWVGQQQAPARH